MKSGRSMILWVIFLLSQDDLRPEVNPNDLAKHQIMGPNLDGDDGSQENNKARGGGEDGVAQDSIRQMEIAREKENLDNTYMEHKDPIALGQMQGPDDMHHFEGENEGIGQQKPPVQSDEVR